MVTAKDFMLRTLHSYAKVNQDVQTPTLPLTWAFSFAEIVPPWPQLLGTSGPFGQV